MYFQTHIYIYKYKTLKKVIKPLHDYTNLPTSLWNYICGTLSELVKYKSNTLPTSNSDYHGQLQSKCVPIASCCLPLISQQVWGGY